MQLWAWVDYSLVAIAQAAAVWLLWRTVGPGHGSGACSHCPSGTRTVLPKLVQLPRRPPAPRTSGKPLVRG
jgi:hypothetical protein